MKTSKKPHTAPSHILRPARLKVQTPAESELSALKAERRASAIARAINARVLPPLIVNTSTTRNYSGAELKPYAGRPDAAQALGLPSRSGNRLRYPDGRVTDMTGHVINDARSTS